MTQQGSKAALAIRQQTHAGIIDQSAFGDRGIAGTIWQLDRQRRRSPVAIFYLANIFLFMNAFVMAFEIVKPNSAARGNRESSSFIRHARAAARNDKAKRDPIVVGAHIEHIVRFARIVPHRNFCAVTIIGRSRVDPARRIFFEDAVALDVGNRAVATKVEAIDEDAQR